MTAVIDDTMVGQVANARLVSRLERLPITRKLLGIRVVVGISTFFDAYTVLALAFAMPQLMTLWNLSPADVGMIIAASYVGQLVGALLFGSLAEKIGRLGVLKITILLFVTMSMLCLFAWSGVSMMIIRFLQGLGIGGEVPVASAYVNEFVGAKRRGRFFLLYEVIFPVGLMFAGMVGFLLVPTYGWKAMFIVGLVPSVLTIPFRWMIPESPRWLAARGRIAEAEAVVASCEKSAIRQGHVLEEPEIREVDPKAMVRSDWRELFSGIYLKRTLTMWVLWVCVYMVNNGLIAWLPTLYSQVFHLSLKTSLAYGWTTTAVSVVASITCALLIDRVGRKRWYSIAFLVALIPLLALFGLGARTANEVLVFGTATYAVLQTIAFSLYLYSAELYPTRLRAIGTGFGSAWLRAGSSIGPLLVGAVVSHWGIRYVFVVFALVVLIGGVVTMLCAIETKGKVLEELSP